jgi:parvulin-like peptidyl-prolyl isomerase
MTALSVTILVVFFSLRSKGDAPKVVAMVNNKKIYQAEIDDKIDEIFRTSEGKNEVPKLENLPQEIIVVLAKEIYLDKIISKEANVDKVSIAEIDRKVANYKNKLLRQIFLESLIGKQITEDALRTRYIELSSQLAGKKEYLISQIVVRNKSEATLLFDKLKVDGSDKYFSELANQYSIDEASAENGGNLGYILEDDTAKEVAQSIMEAENGEILKPIKTDMGWYVVKVSDIRQAKILEYEAVRGNLENQIKKEQIEKYYQTILKDAKIEIMVMPTSKETVNEDQEKNTIQAKESKK